MWSVYAVAGICVLGTLLQALQLLDDWFWMLMLQAFVAPACGIAWLALTFVGATSYRGWQRTAFLPVIGFVVVGVVHLTGLLPRAQFAVSESSLVAVSEKCESATDVWAGAVRIESVDRVGDFCLLTLPGGFLDRVGLVRLHDGPPPNERVEWGFTTEHVDGDWYRFTQYF